MGPICDLCLWVCFVVCCGFFFVFLFFFSCYGLVVVVGVVVAVADGRVVVVGAVDFFWIMGFYCSGYIILL